ncbi:MAG: GNAT family N-acetyltransferase, partial [Solobacterium sp.]|nr:GNAT family N-acetyltransferase [Solobacterium sp.]
LPLYRRRHYAEALESALIRRLQAQDRFVWCQVEEDNAPSWNLQTRLGLVPADLYYWLFRKP